MAKEISKMTIKELEAYCESKQINVVSRNVSKPTKDEYYSAIGQHRADEKSGQTIETMINAEGLSPEEIVELEEINEFLDITEQTNEDKKVVVGKKETRAQKRKKQWDEMMPLKRVLITSNNNNQTTIKNQVNYSTWGNRLLGHHTDRFIVGRPWHLREGALRNLRDMTTSVSIQDEEGNTIRFETQKAYVIQMLEQLSLDEIRVIGKRQIIRDSSIENVI